MKKEVSLTGIKPSGTIHIGNYFGAVKPALELTQSYESRYFIADYHALNTIKDAKLLQELIYEVAATWLAFGLNTDEVLFYRQSKVIETFELATFLSAFTPKGFMNRAHAYKAASTLNIQEGKEVDEGINMGLYTYPVLMAADILLFNTNVVPVGKDQKQHIEIAADIAQMINHKYNKDLFVIPKPLIREETETIIGLDGRKMSKSYDNVIPLFSTSKSLRKTVMKIVTNSQSVEEPKDPSNCYIFSLYKLFSTKEEQDKLKERYLAGGMGWGHAKEELFNVIDRFLTPYREKYNDLMNNKDFIDKKLNEGAEKAKEIAAQTMSRLRQIVGIN